MSLTRKFFSILTIAAGVAVFSTSSLAQDNKADAATPEKVEKPIKGKDRGFEGRKTRHEGFMGKHRDHGMMRMMHSINLTDAQKEQIHSILEANKPNPETMEEFRTLGSAKRDGTITPEQQERLTALKTQAKEKGRAVHEQILGILTTEQKAGLDKKKQEMKQRFEERRQQRQQKPPTTERPKIS